MKAGSAKCAREAVVASGVVDEIESNLNSSLADSDVSRVVGGIHVLGGSAGQSEAWLAKQAYDIAVSKAPWLAVLLSFFFPAGTRQMLLFTVPVDVVVAADGNSVKTVLGFFTLDLARPGRMNFALLCGSFAGFIIGLWSMSYVRRSRILGLKLAANLVSVMQSSPIGFCHLDEHDRIVDSNKAFDGLVGMSEGESAEGRTLMSLLTEKSKARYLVIQGNRARYEMTPPYEVEVVGHDGSVRSLVISGAPLHIPPRGKAWQLGDLHLRIPHTFGVVFESQQAMSEYINKSLTLEEFASLVERSQAPA